MDQGLVVLLLAVLVFISVLALFNVVLVLFKSRVEEAKQIARDSGGRSLAIGFVNALLITALCVGLWALGDNTAFPLFSALGLILMIALVIAMIFGLTAMAVLVSERVLPEARGWRQLAGGGGMLVLASLTPYVGWFLLFPYVVFRGLGGIIQSFVRSWRDRRVRGQREGSE